MPVCPKCGQTSDQLGGKCPRDEFYFISEEGLADAKRDPVIGTLAADKYVILSLINEGGMGAVYRALQLPVEREVAFKVLRAELKDSDQGRDRFIREARAVSRLTHPNIITLHDFGFDDEEHPYMVMEYAPGKSLAEWLKTEQITTDRIVHIGEQILSALTDAHEQGIVHRDLKPENMIITKSGNDYDFVKLLDFGIARLINEGSTRGLTREGEVFGTPHYMAPEQAQGQMTVGPPADVYAVGIMLFEMITGRCPFDAPTPLSVLFMHINEPLPPIEPRNGVILTEGLKNVVRTATVKKVQDRYQAAGEMLTALQGGVPRGAMALGAVVGDLRNGTIAPGSQPLDSDSSRPISRQPQMTPMPASDVGVYDPEPSVERPMFDGGQKYEEPYESDGMAAVPAGSRTRLGLVAAISVLALFLLGGVVYGLVSDSKNVDERPSAIDVKQAERQPTVKATDEVAAKEVVPVVSDAEKDRAPEARTDAPKDMQLELEAAQREAAEKKATEREAAEKEATEREAAEKEAAEKEAAARKAEREEREKQAAKVAAKTEDSTKTGSPAKTTTEKKTEPKIDENDEKRTEPRKFQPKKAGPKKW